MFRGMGRFGQDCHCAQAMASGCRLVCLKLVCFKNNQNDVGHKLQGKPLADLESEPHLLFSIARAEARLRRGLPIQSFSSCCSFVVL